MMIMGTLSDDFEVDLMGIGFSNELTPNKDWDYDELWTGLSRKFL